MNHHQAPKYMLRFFRWFCHPDYVEDIEGDLIEKFERNQQQYGFKKAKLKFLYDVITLFRPSLMRPIFKRNFLINPAMLRQNVKIGFRNLLKNKSYSFIKIGGFAIGIAAFLLIALFVQHELSFDQHYTKGDRVFRLLNVTSNPETQFKKWTYFPPQTKGILEEEYPEVELSGRIINREWYLAGDNQLRRSDQKQNNYEDGFIYADPEMLDLLEAQMVYGNREEALAKPRTIVLTKEKAVKYFPNENPVGKTIILNENTEAPYTIGGVIDFPKTSHLAFNYILTLKEVEFWRGEQTDWCCQNYEVFVRVKPATDIVRLEKKLLTIKEDYLLPFYAAMEDPFFEVMKRHRTFELQPIGDIYLKHTGYFDDYRHSDINLVKLFAAIAVFILLLACINFINLFTAKSANRAKEVGVRKVVGSFRKDLVQQFLTESTLYSLIAVVLGLGLTIYFLPYFKALTGANLVLPKLVLLLPALLTLGLLIGLLAGAYPSFYLSSFKPIQVLKGKLNQGSKNAALRSSLVVFQFAISIVLVVSALVVYHQMQFILDKKIGFDKEKLLMIQGAETLREKTKTFKEALLRLPAVETVTSSNSFPIDGTLRNSNQFYINGREKIDEGVSSQAWRVATNYVETMKINLLQGRNFSDEMAGDTAACIINRTMARELGLGENPIGKQIRNYAIWNIVGVVEDFHFENLKHEIRPMVLFRRNRQASIIATRIKTEHMEEALTSITKVWDEFMPNQPIRYQFMDEAYTGMYEDVLRTRDVFTTCAGLAILIASLGLFGLSAFMAEQRSKEISVRKILGASVQNLFGLLTTDYLKLIGMATLIGIPVSWYLMQNWLQNYMYRIDIAWWFFVIAGTLVAGIALLTVSQQALKLAFSNPIKFLKDD